MSTETQLPIPHNEGTSESPHSNLDPMKVIIQELQQMRKDMMDMRRDMTKLSMEQRGRSNIGEHVTPHTQRGYGSYIPHVPYETPVQSTNQIYIISRHTTPRGGRRGRLGRRGYQRPHEEFKRNEAWHKDNLGLEYSPSSINP
ncbi:hypothetical protein M9H77_03297 [Catharanthus roseus]|uniref:Uncharacterized protein n=1 Tax=Catharanthus roseus TaxID=4058 RepID=A0ACC0CAT9_CATRO|nr:hypothetical protein M9H77_03297 [Catharanthus roseus]